MRKAKLAIFFGIFLVFSLFFVFRQSSAQISGGSDAIAVRIIPNPNHYSIYRWYDSQGFKGSPQALSVDGYEAVRDGRTVYVNAANIKGKSIYTNIYLISYNQDPSPKTVDILGQIVKYWKFNNDIVEQSNPGPQCAISSLSCLSDADCSKDQTCASSGIASSSCQLKVSVNCSTDDSCPQNFFCNSIKSKIIRDLNRIGKTEELKDALFAYKSSNGYYPRLSAGSYLSGHTVSVWPSWSQTFLSELNMAQNLVDPINRLGACASFDAQTCWNKETKRFVYAPTATYLMLPVGSYGFVYKTDANGSNYNLCAVMETREAISQLNFQFAPNNPSASNCVTATGIISGGNTNNSAPRIIDSYLTGEADQEFNGSINVIDDQGNPISWTFTTSAANWSTWSAAPILKATTNDNQKKIYALRAGAPGNYNISLNISDGQNAFSTTTPIVIVNTKPFVESDNGVYVVNPYIPFSYSLYFSDNNLPANPVFAFSLSKTGGSSSFNMLSFAYSIVPAGTNRYKVTWQGVIPTTNKFYADSEGIYRITVRDKYNDSTVKDFKITIKTEAPALTFNCATSLRLGKVYSCFLGYVREGNHNITYTGANLPTGITVSTSSLVVDGQGEVIQLPVSKISNGFLAKLFNLFKFNKAEAAARSIAAAVTPGSTVVAAYLRGTTNAATSSQISIKATNEYGASSTKAFTLNINNYCGDGLKQEPNTEGRGGMYNDGYEDCDSASGLSLAAGKPVVSSNPALQYGCATYSFNTPYPIPNNNYCVYKSPVENGGYCGDGYCQLKVYYNGATSSTLVENSTNCVADCSPTCTPNCTGLSCGTNGCGGSCGTCTTGQTCSNGQCQTVPSCATCGNGICGAGETATNCPNDCTYGACLKDYSKVMVYEEICPSYGTEYTCDTTHCIWTGSSWDQGYCTPKQACPSVETCNAIKSSGSCNGTFCCTWDATIHNVPLKCGDGICSPSIGENLACCPADCGNICTPDCVGKVCGSDGCGGTCAPNNCGASAYCTNGRCMTTCTPNCSGKTCGDDGCGNSCGTCAYPKVCKNNGICCEANCNGCIAGVLQSTNWQFCGGTCCDPLTQKCCNSEYCTAKNAICNAAQ
ncbi:MAG: hypothetical protein WCN88_03805 [Candidatus Falkowbacteria bacterium]